jgi:hypothetical protein
MRRSENLDPPPKFLSKDRFLPLFPDWRLFDGQAAWELGPSCTIGVQSVLTMPPAASNQNFVLTTAPS